MPGDFSREFSPADFSVVAASYLLLRPHYLPSGWQPAGYTATEGVDFPTGWVPTLSVDPLNSSAVYNFYVAGPKDNNQESLNQWPLSQMPIKPVTYWQLLYGPIQYWQLMGLGITMDFPLLPIGGFLTAKVLMTQDGRPIITQDGREIIVT